MLLRGVFIATFNEREARKAKRLTLIELFSNFNQARQARNYRTTTQADSQLTGKSCGGALVVSRGRKNKP